MCIRSFVKYGNLIEHLAHGNHRRMAEKCTLLDTAKKHYHAKLINAEEKRLMSLSLEESIFDFNNFNDLPELNIGWGLPVNNPPVRFTPKQKQYLNVS